MPAKLKSDLKNTSAHDSRTCSGAPTDEFVPDVLVPDPKVAVEFGVTLMSLWRWDSDEEMLAAGWPPRVKIKNRNFRSRRAIEAFKAQLISRAVTRGPWPARNKKKSVAA